MTAHALALLLLLPPALGAQGGPAYDANAAPLDALSRDLLTSGGYDLRPDGKVWDDVADQPVSSSDMPELLTRLAGARRLKTLIQLDQIFTRYDNPRDLSDDDRQAVRRLARDAWAVFSLSQRNDYRSYFTPQELETLDQIPVYSAPGLPDLPEPGVSITAAPPAASTAAVVSTATTAVSLATAPASVAAAPVSAAAAPVSVTAAPPIASASPPAASAAAAALSAAKAAASAVRPALVAAPPPAAAARVQPTSKVVFLPFTVPSGSTSTAVAPKVVIANPGSIKAWTAPARSTAAVHVAVSSSAAAVAVSSTPAPAAAPPPPPPPATVTANDYDKFVADGPYSRDAKDLLSLVGKRAPDFCLPLLRRTVVSSMVQVVIDGRHLGSSLRAAAVPAADPSAPPMIALSPGPVFVERRSGFFSPRHALLLPESAQAWRELGVPPPALDALMASPPDAATVAGRWGTTRVYPDGSRRGTYSPQEQAGELLEQLLLLGLRREGFAASDYAARRWARTAKLMFWTSLKNDFGDAFLDPDRRAELDDWLKHPAELDDILVAGWASAREPVLDARRGPPDAERDFDQKARLTCVRSRLRDLLAELARARARRVGLLEELVDAGLVSSSAANSADQSASDAEASAGRALIARPPACPPRDPSRVDALRKSAKLLAEAARAEGDLRDNLAAQGDDHGPR